MKTRTPIAMLGVVIAGTVVTLWRPAAPEIAGVSTTPAAANSPVHSGGTFPVSRRMRPGVGNTPAELRDRIREALASSDATEREIVLTHLLAALVDADPIAAAQFAETNKVAGTRDLILHRVAQLRAARDTSAALDWAKNLANPNERDAILTDVCLQIAESDPAEAVRTRSQNLAEEKPNAGLEALTQRWAEKDFPSAREWALSRGHGAQRDQLIARLAYVQSLTAPFEAATLVVENIPEGRAQTEAVMAVLHQWGQRDLAGAEKWVEEFSEGDLRARAVNELDGIAQAPLESD